MHQSKYSAVQRRVVTYSIVYSRPEKGRQGSFKGGKGCLVRLMSESGPKGSGAQGPPGVHNEEPGLLAGERG